MKHHFIFVYRGEHPNSMRERDREDLSLVLLQDEVRFSRDLRDGGLKSVSRVVKFRTLIRRYRGFPRL